MVRGGFVWGLSGVGGVGLADVAMTDAERVKALKPYLRHFSDCAFIARGEECDCGLYRILGIIAGNCEGGKDGSTEILQRG